MSADRSANLEAVFRPKVIAVVGATDRPGSVGRSLMENLLRSGGFAGAIHPVSRTHGAVLGVAAYPSIAALPHPADLAIIAVPAPDAPNVVAECAAAGVRAAIVISSGFRETGSAGAALERDLVERARQSGMRIVGPNCLGVIVPRIGLNATFAAGTAIAGSVGFASQSGALCAAILDWSIAKGVGFSHFISAGSMADVGWADYVDHLADDPETKSILLYVESIGDAASFVSAARAAAMSKPVIVMKSGRSATAARAAASHTGSLAGSDEVLDAALRRCGALRVDAVEDLFDMAEVLAKRARPRGKRLAVVTNAGGPGVIAADALAAGGGDVADLSPRTLAALDALLPAHWSRADPVDVLGDADPARFGAALDALVDDPANDAVLAIYAPTAVAPPTATAKAVADAGSRATKPLLAAWMGGASVVEGAALLDRAGIPTFAYPEDAVRAFGYMWRHDEGLRSLYETPSLPPDDARDRAGAAAMIAAIRAAGRTALTAAECSKLLDCYRLPHVPTTVAATADDAVAAARSLGYPVALKLHSTSLLHKTDVGGVRLGVRDDDAVRAACAGIRSAAVARGGERAFEGFIVQPMAGGEGYELILGSTTDPQFGPVIAFGLGGQLVEVFRDSALGLPPLTDALARRLMERTRVHRALLGVRGRQPVDLDALAMLLVRFASLVVDLRAVNEIDLNPLLAGPDRIVALDARVVLHSRDVPDAALPEPVIRTYPSQYAGSWRSPDGAAVEIRPIRPDDEPLVRVFQRELSDESVYLRYGEHVALDVRVAHDRLVRTCFVDYRREIAVIALGPSQASGPPQALGIGQLVRTRREGEAEFAVLVGDRWQRRGLGAELLRRLLAIAAAEGLTRVVGDVMARNAAMLALCARLGFTIEPTGDTAAVRAAFSVPAAPAPAS